MDATLKDAKSPFTPYDVLAYLIPALACVASIQYYQFVIAQHIPKEQLHAPLQHVAEWLASFPEGEGAASGWALQLLILLGVVGCFYVIGHIIASVSEIIIDRLLVHKGIGYPREHLLDVHDKPGKIISRPFYQGFCFWLNVIPVAFYIRTIFPMTRHVVDSILYPLIVVFVGIVILKLVISGLSAPRCRLGCWLRASSTARKAYCWFFWFLKYVFAGLTIPIGILFRTLMQTQRGFDAEFQELFREKYESIFAMDAKKGDSNTYWMPYIYIAERSDRLNKIILNWLNLYSFMRNLSTAFYFAFIYTTVSLAITAPLLPPGEGLCAICLPFALVVASMIALLRFYYLYACYYTKFLYRAFVFLATQKERPQ